MGHLRAFVGFWSDFLVGDRPELFLGPIGALTLVGLLLHVGLDAAFAGLLLALLVGGIGSLSVVGIVRGH
jgi:hypothetical protein